VRHHDVFGSDGDNLKFEAKSNVTRLGFDIVVFAGLPSSSMLSTTISIRRRSLQQAKEEIGPH
jgi:hypothetical protein